MKHTKPLSEFEIIRRYFSNLGYKINQPDTYVELGVGDDCALLSIPNKQRLAVSIDTLVAGQHFPSDAKAFDIAQRALAVSISDLAAMGARPLAFTLALSVPNVNEQWLQQFSLGLRACADYYSIPLIGGDTTKGPLTITIQVHGLVPDNTSLQRSGAQYGDMVFVTGSVGDAAAALDMLQGNLSVSARQQRYLYSRFYQPEIKVQFGEALLSIASAAIDISDGLLADLGHIVNASAVAATISISKLPLSEVLHSLLDIDQAQHYALTGGDDYELCFTVNPRHLGQVIEYSEKFGVTATAIGEIVAGQGVVCLDSTGAPMVLDRMGYQHFS